MDIIETATGQKPPCRSLDKLGEAVIGKPRDPLHPETRHNMALVASGLDWSWCRRFVLPPCYGPRKRFWHWVVHPFRLYLAAATFLTVFIIALAYNQVIELFRAAAAVTRWRPSCWAQGRTDIQLGVAGGLHPDHRHLHRRWRGRAPFSLLPPSAQPCHGRRPRSGWESP